VRDGLRSGEKDARLLDGREFDPRYWEQRHEALQVVADHIDGLADRVRDAEEALAFISQADGANAPAGVPTAEYLRQLARDALAALRDAGGEQ
jgi:hypothetical protein